MNVAATTSFLADVRSLAKRSANQVEFYRGLRHYAIDHSAHIVVKAPRIPERRLVISNEGWVTLSDGGMSDTVSNAAVERYVERFEMSIISKLVYMLLDDCWRVNRGSDPNLDPLIEIQV